MIRNHIPIKVIKLNKWNNFITSLTDYLGIHLVVKSVSDIEMNNNTKSFCTLYEITSRT